MASLCTTCGKSFGSDERLHFHNQIHSEKIFTCKICDKTLIGTKSFNNHIKIHQTFECTLCHSSVNLSTSFCKLLHKLFKIIKKFTSTLCSWNTWRFPVNYIWLQNKFWFPLWRIQPTHDTKNSCDNSPLQWILSVDWQNNEVYKCGIYRNSPFNFQNVWTNSQI